MPTVRKHEVSQVCPGQIVFATVNSMTQVCNANDFDLMATSFFVLFNDITRFPNVLLC